MLKSWSGYFIEVIAALRREEVSWGLDTPEVLLSTHISGVQEALQVFRFRSPLTIETSKMGAMAWSGRRSEGFN
jgi:hypothetical protein